TPAGRDAVSVECSRLTEAPPYPPLLAGRPPRAGDVARSPARTRPPATARPAPEAVVQGRDRSRAGDPWPSRPPPRGTVRQTRLQSRSGARAQAGIRLRSWSSHSAP